MNLRFISKPLTLLAALAMWPGAHAQAQTTPSPSPVAIPASPATSSAPEYRSAFEGYQPYSEEKTINWREANELTGRIGGWRAYAKEAQQAAGENTPAGTTPPDPHAGHGKPSQAKP